MTYVGSCIKALAPINRGRVQSGKSESAHKERMARDLRDVQISDNPIFHCFPESKLGFIFIYEHTTNQTVLDFQLVSYFTNLAVQSVRLSVVLRLRTWTPLFKDYSTL